MPLQRSVPLALQLLIHSPPTSPCPTTTTSVKYAKKAASSTRLLRNCKVANFPAARNVFTFSNAASNCSSSKAQLLLPVVSLTGH